MNGLSFPEASGGGYVSKKKILKYINLRSKYIQIYTRYILYILVCISLNCYIVVYIVGLFFRVDFFFPMVTFSNP